MQRPEPLYPLFAPLASLPGAGPKLAPLLAKLVGGETIRDLLFHLPSGLIDRRPRPRLIDATPGAIATIELTVEAHEPTNSPRHPRRIRASDGTTRIDLVFFHSEGAWLARTFPPGARRVVSGRLELFQGRWQMAHPDFVATPEDAGTAIPAVQPVYPLTAGLMPRTVARLISVALDQAPDLPEWLDPELLAREGWPDWHAALLALHRPDGDEAAALAARRRLAYDELLATQIALALTRDRLRRAPGRAFAGDGHLRAALLAGFGHPLTAAQAGALAEIDADLAAPRRMLRLLQGDVGAGKTLVATLALLRVVEAGAQGALMAPTELLARQHAATLTRLCAPAGVEVGLLTGQVRGAARAALLERLASGARTLVVGTHALFQEEVTFRDLGLAVIDEQHRFGVHQRLMLSAKGEATDVLVMTATPIPRTLLLTAWGDMEVSRLLGRPPGRRPIRTTAHKLGELADVVAAVGRALTSGARVYWVCPLVEETAASDLAAAEDRFAHLKSVFGAGVVLAHGKMKAAQRDAAMTAFRDGLAQVLVATTVIEVGVDVPEARVMVIEHAERFGLAQLHQLRGRVGRGTAESFCLLLWAEDAPETARRRIEVLRGTEDGFLIADEDFRLRGPGEALGTRQSGEAGLMLADPVRDEDLLARARDDAGRLLALDPDLGSDRGRATGVLLHLFEREAAMATLAAG